MTDSAPKKSKKRRHNSAADEGNEVPKAKRLPASKAPPVTDKSETVVKEKPMEAAKDVKPKQVHYRFPKRTLHKSWLTHISAVVISRLASEALVRDCDPRLDNGAGFSGNSLLTSDDLRKLWFYIGKEYSPSERSLNDVLQELVPLRKVTPAEIMKQEVKVKYKDQIPKQPMTPYFLFAQSKHSKLKERHPELGQVDLARKLSQKWKEITTERREKYIQKYAESKEQYKTQIEEFYTEHPDARPQPRAGPIRRDHSKRPKKQVDEEGESESDKRYRELKSLAPKLPVTAYFLFVSTKRNRYKEKHPNLKPAEITKQLCSKWHSLGFDRQRKYKRVYEENFKEYKLKMEEFHKQYPGAKEILKSKRSRIKKGDTLASAATGSSALPQSMLIVTSSSGTGGRAATTAPQQRQQNTKASTKNGKTQLPSNGGDMNNGKEQSDSETGDSDGSSSDSSSEEEDDANHKPPLSLTVSRVSAAPSPQNHRMPPIAKKKLPPTTTTATSTTTSSSGSGSMAAKLRKTRASKSSSDSSSSDSSSSKSSSSEDDD